MSEMELEVLFLAAIVLLVDCICCLIAAYRKAPVLTAIAGGGTAGALALVLLIRMVPLSLAVLTSIVIGSTIAWMKAKTAIHDRVAEL